MSEPRKIGIIGRTSEKLCDGQTIKTRILIQELEACFPDCEILVAETYNYKKNPLRLLFQIFDCLQNADLIIILLSRNGMRVIFPIVNLLNKFFRKPILHDCIGCSLDHLVERYPFLRKQLNCFAVNWVESRQVQRRLMEQGVQNVEFLPNFKRLELLCEEEIERYQKPVFEFCTFSRVMAEKGIGEAAQAILDLNRQAGAMRVSLDVYGPFENGYETELKKYIDLSEGAIRYKGVAAYNETTQILKNYYMLLFPTYFKGEGIPGTLIDAFSAALPVIASNWHCNGEIIEHGRTGFLFELSEPWKLTDFMKNAIENPDTIYEMKKQCLKEANFYSAECVMRTICAKIEQFI